MIKVKVTRNIIRRGAVMYGLTIRQIATAAVGLIVAVVEIFLLKDITSMDLMMTIVFATLVLFIGFGVVHIQGMSLFKFIMLAFKGADKRPYNSKGVFSGHEKKYDQ